ncbi:MAG: hypothetical protein ACRD2T_03515, partial [Thermoanaerobaculia bacterium]
GAGGVLLEGRDEGGRRVDAPVAAVFGSSSHGLTPISVEGGRRIRELRLSYSTSQDRWIMTPGSLDDPDPLGSPSSSERSAWCLGCHSTLLAWRGDRLEPRESVFGVHCERCHGPGSAHLEAVEGRGEGPAIFNPGSLRRDEQVRFCGQCHREPADIEPGDALRRSASMARHAGAGLMLSACFRRSPPERTIACLDCHDAHRNLDLALDRPNQACSRCHPRPGADHASRPIAAGSDCVSCHMPVERRGMGGIAFTDHWIRVPGAPAPLESAARGEYVTALEASYRGPLEGGGRGPESRAARWTRLGDLLCFDGRTEAGLDCFRSALALQPPYSDRVRLADRFRKAGKTGEAAAVLEEAARTEPLFNRAYHALIEL